MSSIYNIYGGFIELKKLKAKNYQMGEYQSFMMDEIAKMDPIQLNTILEREYKWKDVSRRDYQNWKNGDKKMQINLCDGATRYGIQS